MPLACMSGMAIIEELENRESDSFFSLCLAYMYFNIGELDKGFERLETAKGHAFYPWIRVFVLEEAVRNDPRYIELIREMGLPPAEPLS